MSSCIPKNLSLKFILNRTLTMICRSNNFPTSSTFLLSAIGWKSLDLNYLIRRDVRNNTLLFVSKS